MIINKVANSIIVSSFIILSFALSNCSDYLNIVPDNIETVDKMFENKTKIIQAMATCYAYIPDQFNDHYRTRLTLGNEVMFPSVYAHRTDVFISNRVMVGDQNVDNPYYSYWNGGGYTSSLYRGIRYCNTFLTYVKDVPDLEPGDYKDFVAQVKFLKAYFHFLLINSYGPIVIADEEIDMNASKEELQKFRQPIDDCFEYVVNLIDEAITDLPARRIKTQLGQVDKVIAKSIKAKVLLYWASPLFNGNSEYYSDFIDPSTKKPFFNQEYDKERWLKAANALKDAIDEAHTSNLRLYTYQKPVFDFDLNDIQTSGVMKYAYNNRFSIVDPWNSELVWGYSNVNPTAGTSIQSACQVRNIEYPNNYQFSYNYMSASQFIVDKFFTKNGVLMEEDKTFDYENRKTIVNVPLDNYHKGFLIPDDQEVIVKEYLNREPRFYAWIATDRSLWRTYGKLYQIRLRFNQWAGGGTQASRGEYYQTGIGIKKWVHPETQNLFWERIIVFPFPLIRLSDLYLMYAEALNEYNGPSDEVYQYLDLVRERAGLPGIKEVWSNSEIVKHPGKHLTQEGLRKIIRDERAIELSFEGHQYDDVRRWKIGDIYYNEPIMGWDSSKGEAKDFYVPVTWQNRDWVTPRDYFTPISNSILNQNPNLVQNPGW